MSKKYKLVLSGSGTKFPVFIGAIKRLEEEGVEFVAVCGTSGGAIVAAGLASGLSASRDMIDMSKDFLPRLTSLLDPSLFSLFWNWGLIKGDILEKEFEKNLKGRIGESLIPLKIITVNYDKRSSENPYNIFCSETTPHISLSKAVRASMSIPLVFSPVIIDGDRHIDGGVAANFPIDIFGNEENVIGLNFVEKAVKTKKKAGGIKGLIGYILDIVDIFISAASKEYKDDAPNAKIFNLPVVQSGFDFFMSEEDVILMLESGYEAMDQALKHSPL